MPSEFPAYYLSIADLHEELLLRLLRFRRQQDGGTFSFWLGEADKEAKAWQSGHWFGGKDQFVNVFFAKPTDQAPDEPIYRGNIELTLNRQAGWSLTTATRPESLRRLWEELCDRLGFAPMDNTRVNLHQAIRYARTAYHQDFFRNLQLIYDALTSPAGRDLAPLSEAYFQRQLERLQAVRVQPVRQVSLSQVLIQDYHGIQSLRLEELPAAPRWIFLTGENGFGKTSLLQALATGLYGNTEDPIIPATKTTRIALAYQIEGERRRYRLYNQTAYPDLMTPLLPLACYGAARLTLQARESQNKAARNNTATYHLFADDGNLKNIEYELVIAYYKDRERFDMLVGMLKAVIPGLHHIEIEEKTDEVRYVEQAGPEATFAPVPFSRLASGMRSLIAMTGDIYLRLSAAMDRMQQDPETFPFDLKPAQGQYYQPAELWGVVLIDELDIHLHPKWQRVLPDLLSQVFPRVQFIASTHSPIPLLGAPKDALILTVARTPGSGITVERLDEMVDISTLLPNAILTSPIFGFENMVPESHDGETFVHTEDSYAEVVEQQDQIKRIGEFLDEAKMSELRKLLNR